MFPNTLEDRKKMLSVLITDRSRIFKVTYEIPQNISYHDLRVEKIVLANTWDNVTGNVWTLNPQLLLPLTRRGKLNSVARRPEVQVE